MEIFEIFSKHVNYHTLNAEERSLLAELCFDEHSFQQVKQIMTSAESNLEIDPPPMVLTSLHEVFDQRYSQAGKVRNPSPLRYLWYSTFAVAASMALFFIIYSGFNDRELQKRCLFPNLKYTFRRSKTLGFF